MEKMYEGGSEGYLLCVGVRRWKSRIEFIPDRRLEGDRPEWFRSGATPSMQTAKEDFPKVFFVVPVFRHLETKSIIQNLLA
jgi:hypothetical protein